MSEIVHKTEDDLEIIKDDPVTKKPGKVLTEKQKAFLSALGNEAQGDIKVAMQIAGYSEHTRPDDVFKNLTDEIIEVSNKLISSHSVKAVVKLIGVLDKPNNPGNKDIIAAAKELLDRAGVMKKANEGPVIKADNVFILPAKEPIDKPKLIE